LFLRVISFDNLSAWGSRDVGNETIFLVYVVYLVIYDSG